MFGNSKLKKVLERYKNGKIDAQTFVNDLNNVPVYYSTPTGEDNEGNQRLYVLSQEHSRDSYYPGFLSKESLIKFFNSIGRKGFVIIEGEIKGLFETMDSIPFMTEFGTIIEPNSPNQAIIPPHIRINE